MTPAAILPPVSTTPATNFATSFASVVDTSATAVVLTEIRKMKDLSTIYHAICDKHTLYTVYV
jgi:hypothetical protein